MNKLFFGAIYMVMGCLWLIMGYLWLNDFFADCSSYNEDTDACRSFGISEVLQSVARGFQNVASTLHVATANGIPKEQKK